MFNQKIKDMRLTKQESERRMMQCLQTMYSEYIGTKQNPLSLNNICRDAGVSIQTTVTVRELELLVLHNGKLRWGGAQPTLSTAQRVIGKNRKYFELYKKPSTKQKSKKVELPKVDKDKIERFNRVDRVKSTTIHDNPRQSTGVNVSLLWGLFKFTKTK